MQRRAAARKPAAKKTAPAPVPPAAAYPPQAAPQGYPPPQQGAYPGNMYPGYAAPAGVYGAPPGYAPPAAAPGVYGQPQPVMAAPSAPPQPMPYPPQQPYAPAPVPQKYTPKAKRKDSWMPLVLLVLLPVLFLVTLFFAQPVIKWIFIGLALVSLLAMWLKKSFVSSARATLSLVYSALMVVTAVSLVTASSPIDMRNGGGMNPSNPSVGAYAPQSGGAGIPENGGLASTENPLAASTPAPTAEPPGQSEAEIQLENFMQDWGAWKVKEMTSYCAPSWASSVDDPKVSLFSILQNRLPLSYEIESISGTDADSSRTVTMSVMIDKRNGRDPAKYRFSIIMLKENGSWYVDPKSIVSNAATPEPGDTGVVPTPEPSAGAETDPNLVLYYNKSGGGSYYHADANCSSVGDKYKPLDGEFYYKDINTNANTKSLERCTKCNAPARPLQ